MFYVTATISCLLRFRNGPCSPFPHVHVRFDNRLDTRVASVRRRTYDQGEIQLLNQTDNEYLCRVGPGTPMGE